MFLSLKTNLICVLLLLLLLSTACAQAEPTPIAVVAPSLAPGEPTPVVVRILNLDLVGAASSPSPVPPSPTPLPTLAPLPTPTPAPPLSTIASTNTVPPCTNIAEFIKSLSVSDFTAFKPGQSFAKIWQIRNAGTCTWTTDYSLVYASGESMGSLASMSLPHQVNPGEIIDLRLSLVSPQVPNTYTGNWYLQDASGALFGMGADGTQPLGLTIVVRPLPRPPI